MMKKKITLVIALFIIMVSYSPLIASSNDLFNAGFPFTEDPLDDFSMIQTSNAGSIDLSLLVHDFNYQPHQIHGTDYLSIGIGEESQIINKGYPDLPNICRSVIIPSDQKMKVNIIDASFITIHGIDVAPSKGHIYRPQSPEDVSFEFGNIYQQNTYYPQEIVTVRDPYILRDFRGQTIVFQPFQYNPVLQTLRVYTSIDIELVPDGPGEINVFHGQPKTRVPTSFLYLYQNHFLNFGDFGYTPVPEEGNLLIITYDAFYDDMQPFLEWKQMKGIPTEMINVSTAGGSATNIKTYIENYYNNYGLTFVLLVGDIAQVPSLTSGSHASDPSYGYIDGSDSYPEIFIGRFSAQNSAQLATMINRTITYEKTPDLTLPHYQKGLGIASNEGGPGTGKGDDGESDWTHLRNIRNDLLNFTYIQVDELYDGSHGGEDGSGNPSESDVAASLNDGRSIVNYCGHGSQYGWSTSGFGSSDVHNLVNDNMLPFIISVACNNGEFDSVDECFCEAWLRATNDINGKPTGAIVATGSSKSMAWDPPMDGQDEMNDLLTEQYPQNIMHTIGGIHANGCMHMNDEYGSSGDAETDTWHIFGDPSLVLRTDIPGSMTVNHQPYLTSGSLSYEVTVVNIEHALCAISHNGILLGFNYTDSNGDCVIEFEDPISDMETAELVVTAFNKNPYITTLNVLPPVRQPAEFEPMESVLIRYPFGITLDLIKEMAEDVEVITIVGSTSEKNTVESMYQNHGINTDHTSYLIAPSNSYWTRDYGPWFVFNQTTDSLDVIDFLYNRPRPDDNAIPSAFAANQSLNYTYMDLEHAGGNYMTDGQGISVSTELVWSENSDKTHEEINQTVNQFLGIQTYHVRPDVNGEYIKHVDCWAKYLSPDTILIREVPPSHSQYDEIEDAVSYFEQQQSCYGTYYDVVRVYTPNNEPYTNSLILNDKVLVPQTGSQWDDDALLSYESAMPGYEVLGFTAPSGSPWESTDALHCRNKGVPDREMLYISHTPLTYQLPSDDGFYIEAEITAYSKTNLLPSSPTVAWKNTSSSWNTILMSQVDEGVYGTFIPNQPCGEIIDYYINAQDASGRNENHPFIGADDPHQFTVTLVPDIWIHPDSFSFSNSAGVLITDNITIGNHHFAGAQLNFTLSCTNNEGYDWLDVGTKTGSLQPGEQMNISVLVNTSSLPIGDYTEYIVIDSNDLDEEILYVPVNLSVILAHDVGTISINNPTGNVSHGFYTVNATIENFGSQPQTDVIVNCTIMQGVFDTFLYEDFSGAFPPEGWTQEESDEWRQHTGSDAGGTSPEAYLYYYYINGDYACLNSKPVNTIGSPSLTLRFNHSISHYTSTFNCRVLTRSDSMDSWTDVTPWSNPVSDDIPAEEHDIDISSDIGSATQVKFEFQGNDWNLNDWYLDDVKIFSTTTRGNGDIVFTTENMVDIDSLMQKNVLFTPDWHADSNGFYAIEVTTKLTADQQLSNNNAIGVVEVYQDVSPPDIDQLHAMPSIQLKDQPVNISALVTDASGVNAVYVAVDGPAGFQSVNTSMSSTEMDEYYYQSSYQIIGNYTYSLWAEDAHGNAVTSPVKTFSIVDENHTAMDMELYTGWNLLTIPVDVDWMASDLASNIVGCTSVSSWDGFNQTYDTYIVGGPPSFNFPLLDGHGYFVDVDQDSTMTLVGILINEANVSLEPGWNLLGWYHDYNTTASDIAANITGCISVSMWDAATQDYQTYIVGGPPSFDFTVTCGMGIFVEMNQSGIWNRTSFSSAPPFPAKTIWGLVEKSNGQDADGATVMVSADDESFATETTRVQKNSWQVDVGPDTGDEWPDGTGFSVCISLDDWNGCTSGVVKGTYTEVDTIMLQQIDITGVQGGFLLSALITSAESVPWKITVEGMIFFGGEGSGMADGNTQIRLPISIGFGPVDISISAGSIEKQYTATMYGPFILNLKEIK